MPKIERRYVDVGGRRVHYRRIGQGPPVVMLHASPANSAMLAAEMHAAAAHFTCFALDTPGFGDSDPLPGESLHVRDLAAATAAAMAALALPPCPVFGTHSGSAIALELGVLWPDRVTGLVLDAVPVFTDAEMRDLFKDFFQTFPPDPLGGHFTSTWMRFRDQFTWFPWQSRDAARLNPIHRPAPEDIEHWVMMYYRAMRTYMPAYRAILRYGQEAKAAAAALTLPAVFLATAEDMLFGHLDRLPPPKPGQRILRLAQDTPAKHAAIVDCLRAMPQSPPAPMPVPAGLAGADPAVQFLDSEDGQLFIRCYGKSENPALILLHDAPGTGLALQDLARGLADAAYVILPDLPGTGESDAPDESRPILEACAAALGAIADTLAIDSFTIAAIGSGCAVAALFALQDDPRLTAVLVRDVPVPDEAAARAIAPDIALSPVGAHWLQAWLMLRDNQVSRPWYDGAVAAQRRTQGNFDADWLHDQTFALMASRETYHRLPRAAYRAASMDLLKRTRIPVTPIDDGELADGIRAAMTPRGT